MTNGSAWHPFDQGRTIGQRGSENGIILRDEEHVLGARIALERDGHTPFAITCGVYGWMVHTRFFSIEESAEQAFEEMKVELTNILSLVPSEQDQEVRAKVQIVIRAISDFVERFP